MGPLDLQGRTWDHFHCAVEPLPGHGACGPGMMEGFSFAALLPLWPINDQLHLSSFFLPLAYLGSL